MRTLTVDCNVNFRLGCGRRKGMHGNEPVTPAAAGRVLRVARLLALAIRFDEMIRSGEITAYAQLAKHGHVSRARISQIMNLLYLAPDIQEQVLFLPRVLSGRDPIHLRDLQPIAARLDWHNQRMMWRRLALRTAEAE